MEEVEEEEKEGGSGKQLDNEHHFLANVFIRAQATDRRSPLLTGDDR